MHLNEWKNFSFFFFCITFHENLFCSLRVLMCIQMDVSSTLEGCRQGYERA